MLPARGENSVTSVPRSVWNLSWPLTLATSSSVADIQATFYGLVHLPDLVAAIGVEGVWSSSVVAVAIDNHVVTS